MKQARFGITALFALFAVGGAHAEPVSADARIDSVDEPPIRLLLNVPAHRLYVYEKGELTHTFRIAVGEPGHETPSGRYRVTNIIWNPWWRPPPSEWARDRQVEPPGSPNNPMGRVKMNFSHLLYIHGNPEVELLGRAASKGCIRMSNEEAIELARLLHSYARPVEEATLADLENNPTREREFRLNRGVPFEVIYEVAEVRNGNLIIYPDIYNKLGDKFDAMVRAVLMDHGIDRRNVNREHLDRLLEKGRTTIVSASLDELATSARVGVDAEAGLE